MRFLDSNYCYKMESDITLIKEKALSLVPIGLQEMEHASLMDRFDVKYLIGVNDLPQILEEASPYYNVLEINNQRIFQYDTLYYDTPCRRLYYSHLWGKTNRYKIRFRNYVESDLSFFEVKYKNNKGKTYKSRIKLPTKFRDHLNEDMSKFLSEITPLTATEFESSVRVYYQRLTLVNKINKERVTIDLNLKFKYKDNISGYPEMVVFEIKQEKLAGSDMVNILKKYQYRPGSISKYCLGVLSTHPNIKYNRFKPKFRKIIKLNSNNVTNI